MHDLASDWALVHAPAADATDVIRKRAAARRIAEFVAGLPYVEFQLVDKEIDIEPARGPVLQRRRR